MKNKIFFAYESGHPENIDAIKKGAIEYNRHQKSYSVQTWEDLKVGGSVINSCIFNAIDKCEIFACDMTYHNHNVLFELGYAIAKEKRLLIFLNDTIAGSKESYSDFKILRNIGYDKFTTSKHISSALQKKIHVETVLINQLVNIQELEKNTHDVFFINSKVENQASLDLNDYFKSDGLKVISNNTSEVEYQSLIWYITNLFKAKNIILHMIGLEKVNSSKYNAEFSFFAGLGFGLGKKILLIAPFPFLAPIDYSDILIEYNDSDDCIVKTNSWIEQQKNKITTENNMDSSLAEEDHKLNLLKLGIGYEIAEEEEKYLLDYFVESESYSKAFNRNSSIVVGRKGSGKSALFIKLINDFADDKDIFNVIIKPDSDELLDNIEFVKLYDNERSKKTFLLTVWKFVFYSKLLKSIIKSLTESNKIEYSDIETELLEFSNSNERQLCLNFYGVVNYINEINQDKNYSLNPEVLTPINNKFVNPMLSLLKLYFKDKKFFKIHLLADNLDKTWDSKNDLTLQSEMILALLEFSGKIINELNNPNIIINTVIFLRRDIYDFILKNSREPDKLTIKSSFIDWAKYPNKLKDLIEARYKYSLELNDDYNLKEIWDTYFSLNKKSDPFEQILKVVVPRPRDIIYFVCRLFECAVNKNLEKVNNDCFQYAIEEYSNFLHNNLIAEMKAEFPEIDMIMSKIQIDHFGQLLDYSSFNDILHGITNSRERNIEILESLFDKQYIVGINTKKNIIYNKYNELSEKLEEKRFLFFKKNKIYIILHPRRYMMKYNFQSSF